MSCGLAGNVKCNMLLKEHVFSCKAEHHTIGIPLLEKGVGMVSVRALSLIP